MMHVCAAYIFRVIEFCNFTVHFPQLPATASQHLSDDPLSNSMSQEISNVKFCKKFRSLREKSARSMCKMCNNQMNSENRLRLVLNLNSNLNSSVADDGDFSKTYGKSIREKRSFPSSCGIVSLSATTAVCFWDFSRLFEERLERTGGKILNSCFLVFSQTRSHANTGPLPGSFSSLTNR